MESKIPLPTDNLYKFLGLFSLAVLITSFLVVVYATNSSNAVVFEHLPELEVLKSHETLSAEQSVRKTILQMKVDVAVSDRKTFVNLAGLMAAVGALGVFVGFGFWFRKIQPLADQLAATQLEMARLQLLSLKADLRAKGVEVDTP